MSKYLMEHLMEHNVQLKYSSSSPCHAPSHLHVTLHVMLQVILQIFIHVVLDTNERILNDLISNPINGFIIMCQRMDNVVPSSVRHQLRRSSYDSNCYPLFRHVYISFSIKVNNRPIQLPLAPPCG